MSRFTTNAPGNSCSYVPMLGHPHIGGKQAKAQRKNRQSCLQEHFLRVLGYGRKTSNIIHMTLHCTYGSFTNAISFSFTLNNKSRYNVSLGDLSLGAMG